LPIRRTWLRETEERLLKAAFAWITYCARLQTHAELAAPERGEARVIECQKTVVGLPQPIPAS